MSVTYRNAVQDGFGTAFFFWLGFWLTEKLGPMYGMAAWGFSLFVLGRAFLRASGSNFNPLVSTGLAVRRELSPGVALVFIASQHVGALLYFAGRALHETRSLDLRINMSAVEAYMVTPPGGVGWQSVLVAFLAEMFFGGCFFYLVCIGTSTKMKEEPWASSLVIALGLAFAVGGSTTLSGGSINPARAIVPVLLAGKWDWLILTFFVYFVAPALGAGIAALLYRTVGD